MQQFEKLASFLLILGLLSAARKEMLSGSASDNDIAAAIARVQEEHGYLIDPHTAVGVAVATSTRLEKYGHNDVVDLLKEAGAPVVCLACAHWAKFSTSVGAAVGKSRAATLPKEMPKELTALDSLPQRCSNLPASDAHVRRFIEKHLWWREAGSSQRKAAVAVASPPH